MPRHVSLIAGGCRRPHHTRQAAREIARSDHLDRVGTGRLRKVLKDALPLIADRQKQRENENERRSHAVPEVGPSRGRRRRRIQAVCCATESGQM